MGPGTDCPLALVGVPMAHQVTKVVGMADRRIDNEPHSLHSCNWTLTVQEIPFAAAKPSTLVRRGLRLSDGDVWSPMKLPSKGLTTDDRRNCLP